MFVRSLLTLFLCAISVGTCQAQGLFAYDGANNDLYSVTSTPDATFIGEDFDSGVVAEIEAVFGLIYANDTATGTNLHVISRTSGEVLNTIDLNLPAGGNVITAMEHANGTMYGGFTTAGQGGGSALTTIDLTTGDVQLVGGFSGINSALGGLAWDGQTMYGISSGGANASLYSFDLATGVETFLTTINDSSGGTIGLTALEFGSDGELYALANAASPIAGHLLSIDIDTGIYTDLGSTGTTPTLNSLTSIPEPASGMLALAAISSFCLRRRRCR
ncbi:MAG: hypothetical protein AAF456_10625 [Planctomycetota bacterium]